MDKTLYRSFNVTIKKVNGRVSTKYVDALDEISAKAEGSRYGTVLRVKPIKHGMLWGWFIRRRQRKGFNNQQRLEFLQTLSNILVGYTLGEALAIIIENFSGPIRDASQKLRQYTIVEQRDPADALKILGDQYIPTVTQAIIRSNAKVSTLHEAFREGLAFQREILKIQASHTMAMVASMGKFVFSVSLVVLTYLFGFEALESVDYFALMPDTGSSQDLIESTRFYTDVAGIAGLSVLGIWFAIICIFGGGRDVAPRVVEKWIVKIPILNGAFLSRVNFMATYQIQKLLSKGVRLIDTLNYVKEDLKDGVLKEDLERVLLMLDRGDTEWPDGFHSFSDLDRALLKSAQDQDEVVNVFEAQSDQFLSLYDKSIKSLIVIHNIFSGAFLFVLILILSILMFLPMIGGFEMVENL